MWGWFIVKKELLVKKDGKIIHCNLLFKIDDDKSNKQYYVYTDNSYNSDDEAIIYVSEYKDGELLEIKSKETMKEIEKVIDVVRDGVLSDES